MTYIQSAGGEAVPSGTISPFGDTTLPSGWLACDGSAVSRTTYADLFAAIGTYWGVGDGSTTFNLPDGQGMVIRGVDTTGAIAETGGAQTVTLVTDELPSHSHSQGYLQGADVATGRAVGRSGGTNYGGRYSGSTGGGSAHNNMQPYVGIKWMIKV